MKIFFTIVCLVCLTGCATSHGHSAHAVAEIKPTQGNQANGLIIFEQKKDGLTASIELVGLTPGPHGFHIHENGDCSANDAMSAGGHYNPYGKSHGAPEIANHHAGDLGNIIADEAGNVKVQLKLSGLSLAGENDHIVGRSVIMHARADDLTSQPAGNSGARIACGAIQQR